MKDLFYGVIYGVLFMTFVFVALVGNMALEGEAACKEVSKKPYCYREWVAYDEVKK